MTSKSIAPSSLTGSTGSIGISVTSPVSLQIPTLNPMSIPHQLIFSYYDLPIECAKKMTEHYYCTLSEVSQLENIFLGRYQQIACFEPGLSIIDSKISLIEAKVVAFHVYPYSVNDHLYMDKLIHVQLINPVNGGPYQLGESYYPASYLRKYVARLELTKFPWLHSWKEPAVSSPPYSPSPPPLPPPPPPLPSLDVTSTATSTATPRGSLRNPLPPPQSIRHRSSSEDQEEPPRKKK